MNQASVTLKITTSLHLMQVNCNFSTPFSLYKTVSLYCKRGYFGWGKFRENVGKTFHVGVTFTIFYSYFIQEGIWDLFSPRRRKHETRKNYPHTKISTFTVCHFVFFPSDFIKIWSILYLLYAVDLSIPVYLFCTILLCWRSFCFRVFILIYIVKLCNKDSMKVLNALWRMFA